MNENIKIFLELNKIRITFAVSITTFTGYVLKTKQIDAGIILPVLGIFILACGSSVINHYQERHRDALMDRTKNRPIPGGKISAKNALIIAICEIIAGSVLLFTGSNITGVLLGWIALIWYNLIYTNLKKVTAHAVIPGALIGSIPPLVGWVSAGGELFSYKSLIIATFFFIWQVPHFLLLALKFGDEYKKARFPVISQIQSTDRTKTYIFIWILATSASSMLFPVKELLNNKLLIGFLVIISLLLIVNFSRILKFSNEFKPIIYFKYINYYVLITVLILCVDQFIN